jgi:hypothetical protein
MTHKIAKRINIARGFFTALAAVLALSTLISLGMNMDYANFPGSNLVLDSYAEDDAEGRSGLIKLVDGYQLKDTATCSNFRELKNSDNPGICASVKDDAAVALEVVDDKGADSIDAARGWLVGVPCVKTGTLTVCSPFGIGSFLSGAGQATFGVLAINVVLFGAHTGVESKSKKFIGLFGANIVWTVVAFSLYVWAAVAWSGFCDKIDTGLGRHVVVGAGNTAVDTAACATEYCTLSFGGIVSSFAAAIVFAHIPTILMFFGVGGLGKAEEEDYSQLAQDEDTNAQDEDTNDEVGDLKI